MTTFLVSIGPKAVIGDLVIGSDLLDHHPPALRVGTGSSQPFHVKEVIKPKGTGLRQSGWKAGDDGTHDEERDRISEASGHDGRYQVLENKGWVRRFSAALQRTTEHPLRSACAIQGPQIFQAVMHWSDRNQISGRNRATEPMVGFCRKGS